MKSLKAHDSVYVVDLSKPVHPGHFTLTVTLLSLNLVDNKLEFGTFIGYVHIL